MRVIWIAAATAIISASPGTAQEQPSVGDLFEAPSSMAPNAFEWQFRGWTYHARGEAIGMGRFVLFRNGPSYMIAATEVITPSREVGHDGIQRIVATRIVTASRGEQEAVTCDFVTLTPALAFYVGNMARGFFVVGSDIIERRWFTTEGDCYASPD